MSDFEFSEDRPPTSYPPMYRKEHRGAFSTMLGGSLGCVVAMLVVFALCVLACGGCVLVGALNSKAMPENLKDSRK